MLTSFLLSAWPWLLAITLVAAVTDVRTGLIPNWLTMSPLLLAPLAQLAFAGPGALGASLASALLCGAGPLLLFVARAMGGGDVKLFAAIGALGGPSVGLEIQLVAYVIALLCALGMLARRGTLRATLERAMRMLLPRRAPEAPPCVAQPAASSDHALEPAADTSMRLGAPVFAATLLALALRVLET